MNIPKDHYLGDGLYAGHDNYQIYLSAPREDGDHWVALDNRTLASFLAYIEGIKQAKVSPA